MAQLYVGRLRGVRGFEKLVVIKQIYDEFAQESTFVKMFIDEARLLARIAHPNVVPIYTVASLEDGLPYLTMRFVPGGSLAERIERDGPVSPERAMTIVAQIASALEAAHRRGIVHRDVKPGNVLVDADASNDLSSPHEAHDTDGADGAEAVRVLLTDFGIAKAAGERDSALTTIGSLVGSPRYMSPEQAAGDELDARSDLYSLGVVAYELIAGRPPFEADSMHRMIVAHLTEPPPPLTEVVRACPDTVAAIVHRCLEKDPARRFGSAAELREAIEATKAGPRSQRFTTRERHESATVRQARTALIGAAATAGGALLLDRALLGGYTLSALVVVGAATVGAEAARRLCT